MQTPEPDTLLVLAGSASFPEPLADELRRAGWRLWQTADWEAVDWQTRLAGLGYPAIAAMIGDWDLLQEQPGWIDFVLGQDSPGETLRERDPEHTREPAGILPTPAVPLPVLAIMPADPGGHVSALPEQLWDGHPVRLHPPHPPGLESQLGVLDSQPSVLGGQSSVLEGQPTAMGHHAILSDGHLPAGTASRQDVALPIADYLMPPLTTAIVVARLQFHLEQRALRQQLAATQAALRHAQQAQQQAEVAQSQHEDRFRLLFEQSIMGVTYTTLAGDFIQVNQRFCDLVGYTAEELLSLNFRDLTHPEDLPMDVELSAQLNRGEIQNFSLEKRYLHKQGENIWVKINVSLAKAWGQQPQFCIGVIEDIRDRKQVEWERQRQYQRERLIWSISQRIRQSLRLDAVFETTVQEVRAFLGTDRVLIYQFNPDWSGKIVAESVGDDWVSMLGQTILDACLSLQLCIQPYTQGSFQAITDIHTAGLAPCYVDLLARYQVRANLVIPILQPAIAVSATPALANQEELWGLLVAQHCATARPWQTSEIELLQQLANQVAIALQQASLYEQAQRELEERRQIETSLRLNEMRFRAIFEQAAVGIDYCDQSGRFLKVNQKLCDLLGYTEAELLTMSFRDITYAADLDADLDYKRQLLAGEIAAYALEKRYVRKDGSLTWVHLTVSRITDPETEAPYLVAISEDINDRKQAEAALRASEERWQLIVQANNDGIWDWDIATNEAFHSPRWKEMLGYAATEILDDYDEWLDRLHPDDKERVLALRDAYLRREVPRYIAEYRLQCRDGSYLWVNSRAQALWDESGRPLRMVGANRDVTSRRQMEEALRQQLDRAILRRELMEAIRSQLDIQQIFTTTANHVGRAFAVSRCHVVVYSEGPPACLRIVAEYLAPGQSPFPHATVPIIENPHAQRIMAYDQAIATPNVYEEPLLANVAEFCRVAELKSLLAVRTSYQGEANGAISLNQCDRYREWQLDEIELLEEIAAQVGIALTHAKLLQQEQQRRHELDQRNTQLKQVIRERSRFESLLASQSRILKMMASGVPLATVLTHLAQFVESQIDASLCGFMLVNEAGTHLYPEAAPNLSPAYLTALGEIPIGPNQGCCGTAAHRREMVIAPDIATDPVWKPYREIALSHGLRSCWSVPILSSGEEVLGTVVVYAQAVRSPRTREQQLLARVTDLARIAIERQRAEAALTRSEQQYRHLVETSQDLIWSMDRQLRITFVNQAARKIFGYEPDAMIGHSLADFILPTEWPQLQTLFDLVLKGIAAQQHELSVLSSQGNTCCLLCNTAPLHDETGAIVGLTSTASDITERKQAEAALVQLAAIVESSGDAIIGIDLDHRITSWNLGAAVIYGYRAEEAIGHPIASLLFLSEDPSADWDTLATQTHTYRQVQHCRKDGKTIDVFVTLSPIKDAAGVVTGYSLIAKDVSDRAAIERIKDEFISIVSHELRTPLTSIRASLGLLLTNKLGTLEEKGRRMLEIAVSNSDRLIRLVSDILDLERLESRQVSLSLTVQDFGELMLQAVESVQSMADKAEVELLVVPLSVQVKADGDRMLQVLTNLLSNAIKFSEAHSLVSLTAQVQFLSLPMLSGTPDYRSRSVSAGESSVPLPPLEGSHDVRFARYLRVQVKDQGRGVPPEMLETIFDRFQQVDASDSRQKGGTGLGLAICRSIVQQHGGSIWVENNPDRGCTFTFTVPLL